MEVRFIQNVAETAIRVEGYISDMDEARRLMRLCEAWFGKPADPEFHQRELARRKDLESFRDFNDV